SSGANSSSRARISAPICRSGSITRRIGRRLRDLSPVSSELKLCPASAPANNRIVVPLFPASSAFRGAFHPQSFSFDDNAPSLLLDFHSQPAQARERARAIRRPGKIENLAAPLGQRCQNRISVRNGFVPRYEEHAAKCLRPSDALFHDAKIVARAAKQPHGSHWCPIECAP